MVRRSRGCCGGLSTMPQSATAALASVTHRHAPKTARAPYAWSRSEPWLGLGLGFG